MKRLLLTDLLWLGVIVLTCLTWSFHDQSQYADRLNHYGLSDEAMVVHTKSQMTPAQAAAKLEAAKLNNLQVQFQTRADQPQIYLYAHGDYGELPIQSGTWFSDLELQSPLPVAVVGQTRAAKLYTASNQRYLLQDQQYLPVLGVVATRQGSQLNSALFLNASAAKKAPAIKGLHIVADGVDLSRQLPKLKAALHATRVSRYRYDAANQSRGWWAENWQIAGLAVVVAAIAVGLSLLTSKLAPLAAAAGLDATMQQAFVRGWWWRATAHASVVSAIGYGIGWWAFYLTDYLQLAVFILVALGIYSTGVYRGLTTRCHRAKGAEI